MEKRSLVVAGTVISAAIAILLAYQIIVKRNHAETTFSNTTSAVERTITDSDLWNAASAYEKKGEPGKAREAYRLLMEKFPNSRHVLEAEKNIGDININAIFSGEDTQRTVVYDIKRGDTLGKIAKKFNTTVELISRMNGLKGGNIKSGKKLKVSKVVFSIVVDKSQNILTLKGDGDILKTYMVSTGLNNSTPVGTFTVTNKIVNPVWHSAKTAVPAGSPRNILGTRWMGISKGGYGIHGTTEPGSIGKSVTAGCVRMVNRDAEELYMIIPQGTEVVIID